jgi:hypothetical protein
MCQVEICLKGGMAAHRGLARKGLRMKDSTKIIQVKGNEALIRISPLWNARFTKGVRCNEMECPKCHTWFYFAV